ncbi:phage GP46 family protein [Chitinibacter sp. S2-10]|uniref:phage GP46 family protein n=1 Tax=Chitinibacter sp. S2-10 TaxID=3373597 RepID=UPI0039774EDC
MELILMVNGNPASPDDPELARFNRAVLISLFTWRRAENGDVPPDQPRQGWWGDSLSVNDKIGSRLWLLARAKITTETLNQARDYCREALQWLLDDGLAAAIDVRIERAGLDGAAAAIVIKRSNGDQLSWSSNQFWQELQNV